MHKAWLISILGSTFLGAGALAACGDAEGSGGSGGSSSETTDATTVSGTGSTVSSVSSTAMASTSTGPSECSEEVTNISGNCDLFLQDCPAGETCIVFGDANDPTLAFSDCADDGLVGLGQPCMPGECQHGMICAGTCTFACCPADADVGANQPCGDLGLCNLNLMFEGTTSHMMVCTYDEICSLFQPDSCPNGKDCHYGGPGFTSCSVPSPGNFMDGQTCEGNGNDCADSAICIDEVPGAPEELVCRYFCQQGSNEPPGLGGCPVGQGCNTTTYDFGFMDDTIGFCLPN